VSVSLPSESSRLAPLEVKLEKTAMSGGNPEASRALESAEAAYKEGRYADSRAQCATLLALRPDLAPRIHQQIGFSWIQEKQYSKAVEELDEVLSAEPDNAQVRAIAAQAALEGGMAEKGRHLLAGLSEGVSETPTSSTSASTSSTRADRTRCSTSRRRRLDAAYVDGYYQQASPQARPASARRLQAWLSRPDGPQAPLAQGAGAAQWHDSRAKVADDLRSLGEPALENIDLGSWWCRRYGTQPGSSDACLIQLATSSWSSWSSSWMSR
jgi:tetratricopeptide (TPR) repeat protein